MDFLDSIFFLIYGVIKREKFLSVKAFDSNISTK